MATIGNLIVKLTADVTNFERQMGQAAKLMRQTEADFTRTARNLERVGKGMMLGITVPLLVIGATAVKAASQWEDAFAGVRKTVDATEQEYASLSRGIRDMAQEIPVAATELAGIAEAAGQLGIQKNAIMGFTRTVADMGVVTNLRGEEGATALARIANIMQSSQNDFGRMGSTLAALDNALATTASEIAEMSLRLAGAGKVVGMSEAQVFALSGALSSVGIEAQAGGSAMSKAMVTIANQVASGGENLAMFAKLSGMSVDQLRVSWQRDAAGSMVSFIEGLRRVQDAGGNVFAVLDALGMSEVRMRDAMLRASGAGDLFRTALEKANIAWDQNTTLGQKAQERYKTLSSQLKMARNRINDVAITLGESLAPYILATLTVMQPFITGLRRMAEGFSRLPAFVRNTIVGIALFLALAGPAVYATSLLYKTMAALLRLRGMWIEFAGRIVFAAAAYRAGAASMVESMAYVAGGMIQLKVIAFMGLVVATLYLLANWEKFSGYARRIWSGVSAVVLYAASLMVRGIGMAASAVGSLVPALRGAGRALLSYADGMKSAAASAWGVMRTGAATQSVADSAAQTAKTGQAAADAQQQLADGIAEAGKAAKGSLQSFDQVHQLQESTAGGVDIPELAVPDMDIADIGGGDLLGGIGDQFETMAAKVATGWQSAVTTIGTAWASLKQFAYDTFPGLEAAVNGANAGIQWVKDNWPTIGPIVETIASLLTVLLIPALITTGVEAVISGAKVVGSWIAMGLGAVASVALQVGQFVILIGKWIWAGIQAVIEAGKIVLAWAMQGWEAVASVATQIGQFVILIGKWVWAGIQALIEGGKIVAAWVMQKIEAIASVAVQVGQFVILGAKWAWMGLQSLAAAGKMALAWAIAIAPIAIAIAAVALVVYLVVKYWDEIKAYTIETWGIIAEWLGGVWEGIKKTAAGVWEWLGNLISGAWNSIKSGTVNAWTWVADRLSSIWDGIKNTASSVWSSMVDVVRSPINLIIGMINKFLDAVSKIKITVPSVNIPLVGQVGGFTVGLPDIPRIPMLEDGGIVKRRPGGILANIGEGDYDEAVVPLPRGLRDLSGQDSSDATEMAVYRGVRDALQVLGITGRGVQPGNSGSQTIELDLDGRKFARFIIPALADELTRMGYRLVLRDQGV